MAGFSVNDAAMDAGFTDSSHFHKMMVKMFGVSPSKFLKDNKEFSEVKCEESSLHFETNVYQKGQEISLERRIVWQAKHKKARKSHRLWALPDFHEVLKLRKSCSFLNFTLLLSDFRTFPTFGLKSTQNTPSSVQKSSYRSFPGSV